MTSVAALPKLAENPAVARAAQRAARERRAGAARTAPRGERRAAKRRAASLAAAPRASPPRRPSPRCRRHPRQRHRPHPRRRRRPPRRRRRHPRPSTIPDEAAAAEDGSPRSSAPGAVIDGYTVERELHDHPAAELRYAVFGPDGSPGTLTASSRRYTARARAHALPPARRALARSSATRPRSEYARSRSMAVIRSSSRTRIPSAPSRDVLEGEAPLAPERVVAMLAPVADALDIAALPGAGPQEPERAQPAARRHGDRPAAGHLRAPRARRGRPGAHVAGARTFATARPSSARVSRSAERTCTRSRRSSCTR